MKKILELPESTIARILLVGVALIFLLFTGLIGPPLHAYISYQAQEGDLLFQSLPMNPVVQTTEGASQSPYSHCGIVVKKNNKWFVLEAIGPVKETPLSDWVAQGREYHFDAFRLHDQHAKHIPDFIAAAYTYEGHPYDIRYRLDDEKIYCSEIIYKAFLTASGIELGSKTKLGDMNWQPYEYTIRQLEGGQLPLERQMITPVSITLDTKVFQIE
jgi:hypothetical protein